MYKMINDIFFVLFCILCSKKCFCTQKVYIKRGLELGWKQKGRENAQSHGWLYLQWFGRLETLMTIASSVDGETTRKGDGDYGCGGMGFDGGLTGSTVWHPFFIIK